MERAHTEERNLYCASASRLEGSVQQRPYRHIQGVNLAVSGRWTAWYALGLYAFILLIGLFQVRDGGRGGYLNLALGVLGLVLLAVGRLRLRGLRTLPSAPIDPSAPAWVRELPTTPAVAAFARRRRTQQLALMGCTAVVIAIALALINGRPSGRAGFVAPIAVVAISVGIALALMPLYSDTGCATYWEAAGPLRVEMIWQMTRPMVALHVGTERLILPAKAARRIAGLPWGAVAATRWTAQVLEVRDWYGNAIYRAPGYRP